MTATQMLASVRNVQEAQTILNATDIGVLDMKEPDAGALGALPAERITEINAIANGQCATSATVGDLPPQPEPMLEAVRNTIALDVTYVKVGLFGGDYLSGCLAAVGQLASQTKLIGVLFADHFNRFDGPCRLLKAAGFHGAMIDTADKRAGSLTEVTNYAALADFVSQARRLNLLCGLAGSLRADDIDVLMPLMPDYLGFRSALCERGARAAPVSADAVGEIATRIAAFKQTPRSLRNPQNHSPSAGRAIPAESQ